VDAGRLHLLGTALRIDTRNDEFNPWAAWYLRAEVERGAGYIDHAAPAPPNVRATLLDATQSGPGAPLQPPRPE
jgi:hypothetical protein